MNPSLLAALAEGAVVVTPNRRLARHFHRQYDLRQLAAGRTAWTTPSILSFPAWLQTRWDAANAADPDGALPLLLTPAQAGLQWRDIVDGDSRPLLDKRGASQLAAEAWALVHAWGSGGESWRAWRDGGDTRDDPQAFAEWAEAYRTRLSADGLIDGARLPDILAAHPAAIASGGARLAFAGFVELTPQQERLLDALHGVNVSATHIDPLAGRSASARRALAPSPRDELVAALSWARERALARPLGRVGIVIEDLAQRRDAVMTLAQEILAPGVVLPGARSAASPFEISLGTPLRDVPLVSAALGLIALACSRMTVGEAAALLRSPYLPAADNGWIDRAAVERRWLKEGRLDLGFDDVLDALGRHAPDLASRWRPARDALALTRGRAPREWTDAWRAWLAAAGWPGSRALASDEYQARAAWEKLLAQFAMLGTVSPRMSAARALDVLRGLASDTVFQPEGGGAPVHILGVLEAAGMDFDALWVAGLTAERWPPPPSPNPLLPIAWQRERNVPRASAARELAYAQALTAQFARAAPEVVFSSAAMIDDHPADPSALILGLPSHPLPPARAAWWVPAPSVTLEAIVDEDAPPLPAGSLAPGGSGLVAAQSDCPFRAVAAYRLRAEAWQAPVVSLLPAERGSLVHAALAALWLAIGDQAGLARIPQAELMQRVEAAADAALATLPTIRRTLLPPAVVAGERRRLTVLLSGWLDVDRARPPFAAVDLELAAVLRLAGIDVRLRLDRVDTLADGGVAIIDYKTGQVDKPRKWFDPRPRSVQLGLYTLAQRDRAPGEAVRAAAFARLHHEGIEAIGLAADARAWPGLDAVSSTRVVHDWDSLEAWWREHLGALGAEIARGHASVTPRKSPSPCGNCRMQALCRVETVVGAADGEEVDSADD